MTVIKRDGREVKFCYDKIFNAVKGAFEEVDQKVSLKEVNTIATQVLERIQEREKVEVEEIQDITEAVLMKSNREDVAKAYIIYRNKRATIRQNKTKLMRDIQEKLFAKNVQNQNANVDEKSFGGRVGEVSEVVLKDYALEHCMSASAKYNHLNNIIYTHDLGSYAVGSHNCLSIPFDDALKNGFTTRQADVRPAQSIGTAFQLLAVIFQLQSLQQFGGCSATHLDWTMVPYVRKSFYKHFINGCKYVEESPLELSLEDTMSIEAKQYKKHKKAYQYAMDMTIKETKQAAEGMFHNLNTLQSRSGNQLDLWLAI